MLLKFTGTNGSMGLRHGETYKCKVYSMDSVIMLEVMQYPRVRCPYSSPQSFADNWANVSMRTREELIIENTRLKEEIAMLRARTDGNDDADCYCE